MIISFDKSYYLILLPIAIMFIIYFGLKNKIGSKFFKNLIIVTRTIVVCLIIFALAGTSIKQYTDVTTTIFAVDMSASVRGAKEKAEELLFESGKVKPEKDQMGIVAFAEKPGVEVNLTNEYITMEFTSYLNDGYTNIAEALKLSSALIPTTTKKRIILISDGNENVGSAISQAKLLSSLGIKVDVYPIEGDLLSEVQLTSINVPEYVGKNTEYSIEVSIDSLIDTTSNIKVFKNNKLIVDEPLDIRMGENKFVLNDTATDGGEVIYRAEISPELDTLSENNRSFAYSYIEDIPSVLIVENSESDTTIKEILDGAKLKVSTTDPAAVPTSLEGLNLYDCIIIADVPIDKFPDEFLNIVENYVKRTGGGLITTGGENSYALGGYYDTILETILPIEMEVKTEGETPDLGMVMVIDRSGSMSDSNFGVSRMEMAKESAIRGLEALKEEDSIGIVAFDSTPSWAVEFQKVAGNTQSIIDSIGNIQPMGGTSILPALDLAYTELKDMDTKLKHIILLTDGQAEQSGYESILNGMKEYGITLSTIAVGTGADTKLLESLARNGNGRYYFTNEFTNLPEIFTKETILAGKEYLNNRTFFPALGGYSPITESIENISSLHGYVGTIAKPRSDVLLTSDKGDPILATWQYGLGRTVAWTSDVGNGWSNEFFASEEGLDIFKNMVSWSMKDKNINDAQISGVRDGEKIQIEVNLPYDSTTKDVQAIVLSYNGEEYDINLNPFSPGVYKGELSTNEEGAYIVNVVVEKENGDTEVINSGFNIPYSQEYDIRNLEKGKDVLEEIANITGGRVLENFEDIFNEDTNDVYDDKNISSILLIIALIIFLIDIAISRFTLVAEKLERAFLDIINKFKRNEKKGNSKKVDKEIKETKKEKVMEKVEPKREKDSVSTASKLANTRKNRRK